VSARRLLLFLAILRGSAAPAPAPGAEPEAKLDPDSAEAKEFVRRMKTEVTRFGFEEPTAVGPSRAPLPGEWERYLEYLEFPGPADPVKNPVIPSDGLRTSRYFGR
jgi:hypothetical protein